MCRLCPPGGVFGGVGVFEADPGGERYVETVDVGGTPITSRGGCEFRSLDALHFERARP